MHDVLVLGVQQLDLPWPMLARLVRELPEGDYLYEPKWDGFRCFAVRDGGTVEL